MEETNAQRLAIAYYNIAKNEYRKWEEGDKLIRLELAIHYMFAAIHYADSSEGFIQEEVDSMVNIYNKYVREYNRIQVISC